MRGAGKISLLLPLALSLVMSALSIYCHHGGVLHYEAERRIPFYLSDAPVLVKLYDSDYIEGGLYQARELSYFFDYLDAKFIALCVAAGYPHFLSLTHYVFLILISLILWKFGVDQLGLSPWLGSGVLLLFWTSPPVFFGGVFFRTAKIGLSLLLVILYWMIFCALGRMKYDPGSRLTNRTWWSCFGLSLGATLFDQQGVFMCGVAVVFLGFWFYRERNKNAPALASAFAAAIVAFMLYNYIVDPSITLSLESYWPDFKYQHLPWAELGEKPVAFAVSGLELYLDAVRFLLGNIPVWAAAVIVLGLAGWALPEGLGLVVSQTVLIWALNVLMILRHPAMVWPDVRRGYYFLPVTTMFAMTLCLTLSRLKQRIKLPNWFLPVLLTAAIAGNIAALPRHNAIFRNGSLSASYKSTPILLDALRNLKNPQYQAPPEIAKNRVYRFFHDGHFSKNDPDNY